MSANLFDTDFSELDQSVTNVIRTAFGVGGLVSLVIGGLILVWPSKSAAVVAGIIAVWAAIAGLVNLAIGIFSRKLGGWPRVGYLLLGVVFVGAAIVAFANLSAATAWLAALLGIIVGLVWILEGAVAVTVIGDTPSKLWTILYATISIIAGFAMLTTPLWGIAFLWWLLGLALAVLGIVQIVRALRFGRR